ncbi:MAG TPA: glycosyltransferase [Gemmataceae bacterium]|nr:glycosyltransferase [Gemmataceae bacterium]
MKQQRPLLHHVGVDAGRLHRYLSAHQYIFRGTPLPYHGGHSAEQPLSFVACVSNEEILQSNLLSSPCLAHGAPHELLLMRSCRSAAEGLNRGLARARHALIVFVHQDVYLPAGWPARFWQQYRLAQEVYGKIGVLGVYGVTCRNGCVIETGKVVDRDHLLQEGSEFPASADTSSADPPAACERKVTPPTRRQVAVLLWRCSPLSARSLWRADVVDFAHF